jgi:hypothetical protein
MSPRRLIFIVALSCQALLRPLSAHAENPGESISIIATPEVLDVSMMKTTIDDVLELLKKGFPGVSVSLNNPAARVRIVLPDIVPARTETPRFARGRGYGYLAYPDHDYEWRSAGKNGRITLTLLTGSGQGASFALYGLLQEKLGFRFYHPKRTLIPHHERWHLATKFRWKATPRFDKKGFHLHTLHPIELTEQLHDPGRPNALADVREYVNWLVRNQQNVMQFYLLRGVDRDRWANHARQIVDYAHRRGVLVGVEISIAMLQQNAFQAVKLLRPSPYRDQADRALAWLFQAKWDFVTIEPTMGEYLPDLANLRSDLTNYLMREVAEHYHAKPFLATHVIRRRDEAIVKEAAGIRDVAGTGILLHSVMCYSASEPKAPVYGNTNQRFVLERAKLENPRRETWYWPESSYWIAFDNSVPLFLLPYLDVRWNDMETMERIGLANHLTFSSGWEWGYWLIDWSIARWAWRFSENGKPARTGPLDSLQTLFPGSDMHRLWREALNLQNHYLKDRELLRFMAALAPFSEIPRCLSRPFQPEPDFTMSWLMHDASPAERARFRNGPVKELEEYAGKMESVATRIEREALRQFAGEKNDSSELQLLAGELTRGLRMTALRARHRSLALRALMVKQGPKAADAAWEDLLAKAVDVRTRAEQLVLLQETLYRYPPELIARKRDGFTVYRFGYLYPVSNLFFWRREEEQIRHERFDPFFMKLWDFWRTVGLESLIF